MSITRRTFLYYGGPLAAVPLLPRSCGELLDDYVNRTPPFVHGVASGDPLSDAVILWTRVTRDDQGPEEVPVLWVIAKDPSLEHVVAQGLTVTDGEVDFTVKVDVEDLKPGQTYYYRFRALGHDSPVGRTRTLPKKKVERLRLAFASCSNYPYGFFNAYGRIAARADLDAVLHLGDYLYEYADGQYGDGASIGRAPVPAHEIVSLEDYRLRHAQYKTDPDLQEAHRQHPFIAVWDDHESANDAFRDGAENHQLETEGDWQARKQRAIRAYFEWMPIRGQLDESGRVYRSFRFGNLVDLMMLDTRLAGRDRQATDACDAATLGDPNRQLLGEEQESWFFQQLSKSNEAGTRWRVIGQQVMFGQLVNALAPGACVFNVDQWDGYAASRARVLEKLDECGIGNVVVLTGDIHSSWGMDITGNPFNPAGYNAATGAGSLAVEFVTPGVTSPGIEDPAQAAGFAALLKATHPHIKFVELNRRGYALLDITHRRMQAEWYHVPTISERSATESLAATLQVLDGTNHLVPAAAPSTPVVGAPPLAPVTVA